MTKHKCYICEDEGWVCEDHQNRPWKWGNGCCGGAGAPCSKCNELAKPLKRLRDLNKKERK